MSTTRVRSGPSAVKVTSISLALALLFLGVFSRCLETGRHRALAGLLLAATGLSHLLPTVFVALGGGLILFLLHRPSRRRLALGITVGALGACLAAFWIVPFAFRLGYSNDMGWVRTTEYLKGLFPFLQKIGPEKNAALRARVAAELKTTFASRYSHTISLAEALDLNAMRAYLKRATGDKYLIDPTKGI